MATKRVIRVEITLGSVAIVLLALGASVIAANIVVSARRVFTWVVASAVVAALIEILVGWLDRWMRRALAIIVVLLVVAAGAGVLTFGVTRALDREVDRLQHIAPAAAADIEQNSKRFGKPAREIGLEDRVHQVVARLRSPSAGLAGQAVSSVGTYTVCIILTILFLSWGPKVLKSAVDLLAPAQQRRVHGIVQSAFTRSRRYVMMSILQAAVVGLIAYGTCHVAGLPASAPLGLTLAVMSLVPNIGIIVGSVPILLLALALTPAPTSITCTVLFISLQLLSSLVTQRWIVRASNLYVGPALISISFLAGFELYGFGGALYAAALFVLAAAAIDANEEITSDERSVTEEVLSTG